MGLPAGEVPEVEGTLSMHEVAVAPDALTERALQVRPDLRAHRLELEAGEKAVALARAEGRPNITAGISYSHERSITELESLEEDSEDNLIGLRLSAPFPVSGRREALLREANARKGAAQQRLAALRKAVSREVQNASTRLASTEASVELYRSQILPQVEQNLEIVRESYRLGEAGLLNVIEERRKFLDVNSGYLQALHDWNHALANLEAAVGSDLSEVEGEQ
jgi:cobalt-zinc-cadmium efflux system outer membrane protein